MRGSMLNPLAVPRDSETNARSAYRVIPSDTWESTDRQPSRAGRARLPRAPGLAPRSCTYPPLELEGVGLRVADQVPHQEVGRAMGGNSAAGRELLHERLGEARPASLGPWSVPPGGTPRSSISSNSSGSTRL